LSSNFAVNVDPTVLKHIFFYYTLFAVIIGIFIGCLIMFMFAFIVSKSSNTSNVNNNLESNNRIRAWNIPPESDVVD